jgi:hypothetical protein
MEGPMRLSLLFILLVTSISAFGQGSIRYFETLTQLLQFNPNASATGPSAVYGVQKAADRVWGAPRIAIWTASTNQSPNGTNVFSSPFGGRWIFPDKDDPIQNSLWYGPTTNKWFIDNVGNLVLGTTNVAQDLYELREGLNQRARFGDLEEYSLLDHDHPVDDINDSTSLTRSIIRQSSEQNIRDLLGLGNSATRPVGTNVDQVAYGNHNHDGVYEFVGVAQDLLDAHEVSENPHPVYIPYSLAGTVGLDVLKAQTRTNVLSTIGSGWASDPLLVLRADGSWSTVPASGAATNGITEAPTNGTAYTRKSAAWSALDVADMAGLTTYGRSFITTVTGITSVLILDSTPAGRALLTNATVAGQRTALGLGSSAVLNVAVSGNAAAGEVVKGNDGRLSDARTPSAHTHPFNQVASVPTDSVLGRTNTGTGSAEAISMADLAAKMRAQGLGTGSVQSVGLYAPGIFNVTGSPVTGRGTMVMAINNQSANKVFAGPVSGIAASPSFRSLGFSDLPAGTWTSGNDGSGSTLDADLLDGRDGDFHLHRENHLGTQPWTTITGTPKSLDEAGITDGVRSVQMDASATGVFSILGGPITNSGTFTFAPFTQLQKTFYAGPVSAGAFGGVPNFRTIVASDLPSSVWTSANDGPDSLLDAGLLESQDGSYYLARANHTGTQPFGTLTGLPATAIEHGISDVVLIAGSTMTGDLYAPTVITTNGVRVRIATRSDSSMPPIGITAQQGDEPYVDWAYTNSSKLSVRTSLLNRGWELINTGISAFNNTNGMAFRYRTVIGWSPWIRFIDDRGITNYTGSGRGWDSDLLDAQDGSYYLARANHTGTQPHTTITGLGSSATLNVAVSGNAAAGEVVKGNDTRLTDSRAPTTHTHPVSQISDGGAFGRQLVQTAAKANALALIGSGWSSDSSLVLRGDGSWSTVPASGAATNGITEAPTNGSAYVRKMASWSALDVADLAGLSTYGRSFVTTSTGIVSEMIVDSSAQGRAVLTNATAALQRTALGLGTVATLNVAASGDAAAGEAVKGDDTRLADSRTPTAHGHVIADTTGLQTALDGKLSLTGGTLTGGLTGTSALFTNGLSALTSRRTNSETTTPIGLSTQTGPGEDNDDWAWDFPYGAKLSVFHNMGRSWELMNTTYPNGSMAFRIGGLTNWSSWKTLLDTTTGASLADFVAHTNLEAGAHGISTFGATLVDDLDQATARITLGLGTAATRNVPASGDASLSDVVLGSDSRLANSRNPLAHTHTVPEITPVSTGHVLGRTTSGSGPAEQIPIASLLSGLGVGTVTSVGLEFNTGIFQASGSPVTNSGTIIMSPPTLFPKMFLASANSGGPNTNRASWRFMSLTDLPAGTWTSINDGSGTGLDADYLDSQDSSFYLARANHTGTQPFTTITALPPTLAEHGITDGATDAELAAHAATTSGTHGISAYGSSIVSSTSATAARSVLGLGSAAILDVPSSGNATIYQVVKGDDSRLYDARPPLGHAHNEYELLGVAATLDAAHLAAGDPHGQYVLESSGTANNLSISGGSLTGEFSAGVANLSSGGPHSFLMAEAGSAMMRRSTASFVKGLLDYHAADIVDSGSVGQSLVRASTAASAGDVLGSGRSSSLFLRGDMTWASIPSGPDATNGIVDAPGDGAAYVRKVGAWTALDIDDVGGMATFGDSWVKTVYDDIEARAALMLTGPFAESIDSSARYGVRANNTGGSTRHRLNMIGTTGIIVSLADDGADDETDVTLYLASRDYGDVTVSASGSTITIDPGAVSHSKIQSQTAATLLGRGTSGSGSPQEIQAGSGLAVNGTVLSVDPSTFISGQVLYVSKEEKGLFGSELDDEAWHSIAADPKPGTSKTIPGGLIGTGTTIKIEAMGTMTYGDNPSGCKMRVRIGGLSMEIPFDEPESFGSERSTVWNIEAKLTIKSSGSEAVVRGVGFWDYTVLGAAPAVNTGYLSYRNRSSPISGILNTSASNDIGVDFFGSDVDGDGTQFTEMTCESVIVTRY